MDSRFRGNDTQESVFVQFVIQEFSSFGCDYAALCLPRFKLLFFRLWLWLRRAVCLRQIGLFQSRIQNEKGQSHPHGTGNKPATLRLNSPFRGWVAWTFPSTPAVQPP
jgi:hypothetical protein